MALLLLLLLIMMMMMMLMLMLLLLIRLRLPPVLTLLRRADRINLQARDNPALRL
jgi:hypothetical protein